MQDIVAAGEYHPSLEVLASIAAQPLRHRQWGRIAVAVAGRARLRAALLAAVARHGVAALVYPNTRILAPRLDETWTRATFPTNGVVAAQSDLPVVCLPAGFAPCGVPVGLDLLGGPRTEPRLLGWSPATRPPRRLGGRRHWTPCRRVKGAQS